MDACFELFKIFNTVGLKRTVCRRIIKYKKDNMHFQLKVRAYLNR